VSATISGEALAALLAHLAAAYPGEGCGVLVGREQGGSRRIERAIGCANVATATPERRYLIAPGEFLAADHAARADGLEVLGFFHSHPDHPAVPSAFDLERAWPYYSYLIVSLARGVPAGQSLWRLRGDRAAFEPEPLTIDGEAR
jgi:proteasome lid subunit RPN8/RPN11